MFFSKANRVGGIFIRNKTKCLSPNPPPRPRPCLSCASTAASASRSRWTTPMWPLKAAKCSGVEPHKPRPKAKPQTGENSEKCWVPQKSKFGKLWSPKLPVNLRNIGVLRCLEVIQLAHVAVGILWHSIEDISATLPAKMTSINLTYSSSRKHIRLRLGHRIIWKIPLTCCFAPHVSRWRPNMAKLANMEKLRFKLWDLQKGKCHMSLSH